MDFDSGNAEHQRIKKTTSWRGDALPDIAGTAEVSHRIADGRVRAPWTRTTARPNRDPQTPWYRALQGRDLNLSCIPRTPFGRTLTNLTLRVGERLRVFPEGLPRGQHAVEQGGGRAGRRRQVRHLYADVFRPGPQAGASERAEQERFWPREPARGSRRSSRDTGRCRFGRGKASLRRSREGEAVRSDRSRCRRS